MIAFDNMSAPSRLGFSCMACAVLLSACGGGGETQPAPQNAPPVISGTPTTSIQAGSAYTFQPTASDPEGSALSFSVQNKPAWATFSTSTGALTGTPGAGDAGITSNIVIQASDGTNSVSLAAFSLTVTAPAPGGSLRVDWTAPTQNTDGSPLTGLSGFRILYGTSASTLTQSVVVAGAATRSHTVGSLSPGTYYFSVVATTSSGAESSPSAAATGVVP